MNTRTKTLIALGLSGYWLRLVLALVSEGSNDIRTWRNFAVAIRHLGLERTYIAQPLFNHPPLIALWSVLALNLSELHVLAFEPIFKAPSLLAEVATGIMLVAAWKRREEPQRAFVAFAAYGLSLSCILISAFHGNTDAIYFCLAFASAYLIEADRPLWAGLALAASFNIKLIPILLVFPLASRLTRWHDIRRFLGGAAVGSLPFVWVLLTFSNEGRSHFVGNIFLYHSNLENWGVELAVRWAYAAALRLSPMLSREILAAGTWYEANGASVMLATLAGMAVWHGWRVRAGRPVLNAYDLAALTFAVFLLLGSGFGVQYVGSIVAPLLASTVWGGAIVSTMTGIFIGAVYLHFVVSWTPIATEHLPTPRSFSGLSALAWISIAVVSLVLLRARLDAAAVTPPNQPYDRS